MKTKGGDGVEVLRAEYLLEHALEIPGRSRRLLRLLGRVMQRARYHASELDPRSAAFYALGCEISMEIAARARSGTGLPRAVR